MSMTISGVTTADLPAQGARLANVVGNDVYIYPKGVGQGPLIAMSRQDWARIAREVMLAFTRADKKLDSYTATEGNGYE